MTVEVELAFEGPFTPNGVTVAFPFTFKIATTTEVVVTDDSGTVISSSLYTVTLAEDGEGGTITFAVAPTIAQYDEIYIVGAPNFKQQVELTNDNLSIVALNNALNRSAMRDLYLKGKVDRSFKVPLGETADVLLPSEADRANKYIVFDATGKIPRVSSGTGADAGLREDLADGGGSLLVNHRRTPAAILRSSYSQHTDVFNMKEFCLADGSNQNAAFAAGLAQVAIEGKKRIIMPSGHYVLNGISIAQNDLIFEGDGETTLVEVGANNAVIFNVTGQRATFKGMKMLGDGTTTNSANGIAILAGDSESLLIEDVWFDTFGMGAINAGYTSNIRGMTARRTRHRNTVLADTGSGGGIEIQCRGQYESVLIEDIDAITSNADWAFFTYDQAAVGQRDTTLTGGNYVGYGRYSIGVSDENVGGEERQFGITIKGGFHKSAKWGSIKVKNQRGVLIDGVTTESCGIAPSAAIIASGESGSMYINSGGLVKAVNCQLKDSGNDGIVLSQGAPYPFTNADGTNRSQYILAHNQVDGCGTSGAAGTGTAFRIAGGPHQVLVTGNQARGAVRYVCEIGVSAADWIETAIVKDNDFSHNPGAQAGILAHYVRNLKTDGNDIHNTGLQALYTQYVDNIVSGPTDRFIDTIGGGFNVRLDDAKTATLLGDYGCTIHPAWAATTAVVAGQKVSQGANTYVCELGGTTGSTNPTHTSGTVSDGGVNWRYWGKHRAAADAVALRGVAATLVTMSDTTRTTGTASASGISFSPFPTRWAWQGIDSGRTTFASAATKVVTFNTGRTQIDTNFNVLVSGDVNETFWVTAKSVNGFTINSSNATSTATVSWSVSR